MRREVLILGVGSVLSAGVIVGGIVWGLRNDQSAPAAQQGGPQVFVTTSARDGRVVTGADGVSRLVLTGVQPAVEMADMAPGSERLRMPTWLWSRMWTDLYAGFEPNATLSWGRGADRRRISVALVSGAYTPGRLSFAVRPLAPGATSPLPVTGALPIGENTPLGPVDLYVDPPIPNDLSPDQSLVSQAMSSLAGIPFAPNSLVTIKPPPPGTEIVGASIPGNEAYQGMALASGYPQGTAVDLTISGNPVVGPSNLAGRTVTMVGGLSGGASFEQLTIGAGTLNIRSLRNAVFVGLNLSGGTLNGGGGSIRNGVSTMFLESDFSGATLNGPTFENSIFASPNLDGASFPSMTDMSARPFNGTVFMGTDFTGLTLPTDEAIDFGGVTIAPFQRPSESGGAVTVLSSFANMQNLGTAISFGANGGQATLLDQVQFTNSNLQGTSFREAVVTNCDFSGTTLGVDPDGQGNPDGTSFKGATISGGSFSGATITEALFNDANISGVNFGEATFNAPAQTNPDEPPAVNFNGATLTNVGFLSGSGIENAGFEGAVMSGVVFATNQGNGSSNAFVATLLGQIADTAGIGVSINNANYVKQGGVVYQVLQDGNWQPMSITNGQVSANGDPVAPGGGGALPNPEPPPDPDPGPDPNPPNPEPQPSPEPPDNGGGGGDEAGSVGAVAAQFGSGG